MSNDEHRGDRNDGILNAERYSVTLAERHGMPQTITATLPAATRDISKPKRRVLLVDDNDPLRQVLNAILEHHGFDVEAASNVNDALKLIASQTFDVLSTDLQMPDAGDGLTVVSAMRHSNPKAVTFILSGYPEMDEAARAILRQTDEVLTKPIPAVSLVKAINDRLRSGAQPVPLIANFEQNAQIHNELDAQHLL